MPTLRRGDDDRIEGEDLAVARHRWYWSRNRRPGHGPPDGWDDSAYAPPEFLEQAYALPPAATHDDGCWCTRCYAASRALGIRPGH